MKQETPSPAPALSLQNKLDRIAHERAVLTALQALARMGVREGDRVICTEQDADGTANGLSRKLAGRVLVAREEPVPVAVVLTDNGKREPFDATRWQRA